jgi:hypothetical protein
LPTWAWITIGVAALLAFVFVLVVIAHFPRDNSF